MGSPDAIEQYYKDNNIILTTIKIALADISEKINPLLQAQPIQKMPNLSNIFGL
jgi:uncharacterized protein YehS (DUF1456 family)